MIATQETTKGRLRVGLRDVGVVGTRLANWLSFGFPLLLSAILNMWNLAQNGYSNSYYAVAVQSMLQSWHNFFFASYDAGGFITVDKPPVALWVQAISAKIFGFSSLSLLMPEAIAGVACVGLVYYLVKRHFGVLAGFLAALAMALTPIAVAVERGNNTDTVLLFTLLLAAWALSLAVEKGRLGLLLISLALVGAAFNIKMLAAFVVLPTFYLLYLIAAPISWTKRIVNLTVGSAVLFGVALSWPLAVDLTPPTQRPWVGGSQHNSVLELALGYNGLGRVTGNAQPGGRGGRGGFGGPPPQGGITPGNIPIPGGNMPLPGGNVPFPGGNPSFGNGGPPAGGFGPGGPGGPGGMFGAGQPGALRLFTGEMSGQWSWLFPLAALGLLAAGIAAARKRPLDIVRSPRTQALFLWGGWLATYGVVFSVASGIFHPYYLIIIAPATAALVGIGVSSLWTAFRRGGWQVCLLPTALLATAAWQLKVLGGYPQWSNWLTPLLIAGTLIAVVGLIITRLPGVGSLARWSSGFLGAAVVALLLSPLAWSVTPVLAEPSNASLPVAGPEALNQNDPASWTRLGSAANSGLVSYLEANQGGYLYLVAVSNSQQASSIALQTGKPVLASGGFMGSDPALTLGKLQEMITGKQVRFVMGLDSRGGFGPPGMGGANTAINDWVQQNCLAGDPSLYSDASGSGNSAGGFSGMFGLGNSQLYDCGAE